MRKLILSIIFILLLNGYLAASVPSRAANTHVDPQAVGESPLNAPVEAVEPSVTLRAASGAQVEFQTQNGLAQDGRPAQVYEMPFLVLSRNGALTDPQERSLLIQLDGIQAPADAVVSLAVETQHSDPGSGRPIVVWQETRRLQTSVEEPTTPILFEITFDETTETPAGSPPTPTDYFRYEITVATDEGASAEPLHHFQSDYAFLMERQWIAALPPVLESAEGAAPDELILHYADMFPMARNPNDPTTRLPRSQVEAFVSLRLVPAMVEAFRAQTDEWNFPWHPEWTSYRKDLDGRRLSVALAKRGTWYHAQAPMRGHAAISLRVDGGMTSYDSLLDGLMSTFHHELFHVQQRNISFHMGSHGHISGKDGAWLAIAEGTAMLASSVGQTEVQFEPSWGARAYLSMVKSFIGQEGFSGHELNESYEHMNPYNTAPYWRYLFEQCGGLNDPAAGMTVIRRMLESLYAGEVVDIAESTDLVARLPRLMDKALKQSDSCPFDNYTESLTAFSSAIYRLNLADGRCILPGVPEGCGFFDPQNVYPTPPSETTLHFGVLTETKEQRLSGGIPSSFGIDFIDVALDASMDGQPLTIEFSRPTTGLAEFNVHLWKIIETEGGEMGQLVLIPLGEPEVLALDGEVERLTYRIEQIEIGSFNRLGLTITRLDEHERADNVGAYEIEIRPK